jgi:hypothetical protein
MARVRSVPGSDVDRGEDVPVHGKGDTLPGGNGGPDPGEQIECKVATGETDYALVEEARAYWRDYLVHGVLMPNGERATITEADLHHVIDDARILGKPFRIHRVRAGVHEIRTANHGRRMGLSTWEENGEMRHGYVTLEPNGRVRTMDLRRERGRRQMGRRGDLLWQRDQ